MEDHKKASALRFFSGSSVPMKVVYAKLRDLVGDLRDAHAGEVDFGDEDLVTLLFYDGCLVLHFIDCIVKDNLDKLTMGAHLRGFITRDIFLFENQLPFAVLQILMSIKRVNLDGFISKVYGIEEDAGRDYCGARHLLEIIHTEVLGKPPEGSPSCRRLPWRSFRSAIELKEVGVVFCTSKTRSLRDIKFEAGVFHSRLYLPEIVIDDLARSRFLNLISYVCFLGYLIDSAADVKELRKKHILQNSLGSDQQVVDLFGQPLRMIRSDVEDDHVGVT